MSFSPPTILLWAILAVLLQTFLVTHLWKFDRFQCLRWNAGKQPGAFQRVMTYTYLATMPLLVLFSVAMTVVKYREGYVALPPAEVLRQKVAGPLSLEPPGIVVLETGAIIPKPFQLWDRTAHDLVFPLHLIFAVAWSFEMVTHLEEFNFWVFLMNQGERQRTWFGSPEFQWWLIGSMTAVVAMPCVAIFTRQDPNRGEAWIFFIGSIGSTFITVLFLYVLWRFPTFLRIVREGGAPPEVVVRLSGFHEINIIRIGFRFMFTLPLFIMAVDGIRGSAHHPIIESVVGIDFLGALAGVGCMVSSTLTLLVFFPRSRTIEAGYDPREPSTSLVKRVSDSRSTRRNSDKRPPLEALSTTAPAAPGSPLFDEGPLTPVALTPSEESPTHHLHFRPEPPSEPPTPPPLDSAAGSAVPLQEMARGAVGRRRRRVHSGNLHPLIASYTSPINFHDAPPSRPGSRPGTGSSNV